MLGGEVGGGVVLTFVCIILILILLIEHINCSFLIHLTLVTDL